VSAATRPGGAGHAVVTGAASGLGAAVVGDLVAHGWEVTGVDVQAQALDDVVDRARAAGGSVHALVGDLGDPGVPGWLVARAWERRPVDALVNAAGIYPAVPFLELTADAWDRVQHVNVRAVLLATQELARRAVAAGAPAGVVNVSSGAARRARPGTAHYSTSKAALEALTRAAAVELGAHGIRVNAVAPGFVDVASAVNPVTPEYASAVRGGLLPGGPRAEHVAAAVRYLLSDDAAWVTGTTLAVDGGATAGTRALPQHWPARTAVQAPVTTPQEDQ